MKKAFLVLLNFVFTGGLFADTTIVQKMESSGMMGQPPTSGTMTMYIKGAKAKIENMAPGMSQVMDIESGKVSIINSSQKTVMVMTSDEMKKFAGMMGNGGMTPTAQKLGTAKTVNGYSCEEYKLTISGMISSETIACVSGDVDTSDMEKFRAFSEELAKNFGGLPADVKGFPVISNTKMRVMGKEMTSSTELISISKDSISDDIFVIPSDYRVQEMGQMG